MDITTKVKKPVEAIQCANTFSLLQRKMYNVLLANAAGNLHPAMTHRIAMRILCKLMGYHSNDYKTIKDKFRELRRMDIEWDVINENGNKVWTNTSPLSLARVIEGEGLCEYEFTPSLIPFLDRPAQYAKFSLIIQAKFKSSYGLALYENCERYRNLERTRTFDIPTFRKLMGVAADEYLDFFALKRRVITTAIKEVNQYADFEVEADYEKKGRSIVAIRFSIKNKDLVLAEPAELAESPGLSVGVVFQDPLVEQLKNYFGLNQRKIDQYLKQYGREDTQAKVDGIIHSESFKQGLIKNMAGYLKTALVENFQTTISSRAIVEKQRRVSEGASQSHRAERDKFTQLKREYDRYLTKESRTWVSSLGADVKNTILLEFEQYLGRGGYLDIFRREGLDNVLIADRFFEFIKMKHPSVLSAMLSFETYSKKFYTTDE